jgi:hypothetical protein
VLCRPFRKLLVISVSSHKDLDSRPVHVHFEQMGLSIGQNVAGSKLGLVLRVISRSNVTQATFEESVEICGVLNELSVEVSIAEPHAGRLSRLPSLFESVGIQEFEGHEFVKSGWEGKGKSVELVLDPKL